MLNGKDMTTHLKVGLIKKNENTFLDRLEILEEILMLNLIFLIMQQKPI